MLILDRQIQSQVDLNFCNDLDYQASLRTINQIIQEFLHYSCIYILKTLNTKTTLSQLQVQAVFLSSTLDYVGSLQQSPNFTQAVPAVTQAALQDNSLSWTQLRQNALPNAMHLQRELRTTKTPYLYLQAFYC